MGWKAIDALLGIVKDAHPDMAEYHDKYLYGYPPKGPLVNTALQGSPTLLQQLRMTCFEPLDEVRFQALGQDVRIPLIVIAGSGIVISDSAHRDHPVGAKRR